MFSIMKQKPEPQSMEYVPGLRLSSSQQPRVDNYLSPCSMLPGQARLIPSMNREKRRRAYTRIMSENARILERISTRKAVYSRDTWDKDRKRTEHYLGNIGKDLTTGYLPQGPDGRSVYFDPRALSPSARLPRLRKTQTRRGRSRRCGLGECNIEWSKARCIHMHTYLRVVLLLSAGPSAGLAASAHAQHPPPPTPLQTAAA